MFVSKAGEHLIDIFTVNPELSGIASASSILDTSNYTFQAISFGKDSQGYKFHAHVLSNLSDTGVFAVYNAEGSSVSSYSSSATASAFYPTYKLNPSPPYPTDTRLEMKSTQVNTTGSPDIGHNLNYIILTPSAGTHWDTVGCYPASSGTRYIISNNLSSLSAGNYLSGTLSGYFNRYGLMDVSGFLTVNPVNASAGRASAVANAFNAGALRYEPSTFGTQVSDDGSVSLAVYIASSDGGALALFGGVYEIGVWCLDLKSMVAVGNNPPYPFNYLNNIRKYKLFAKKVFYKDILFHRDVAGVSAFKTIFENTNGLSPGGSFIYLQFRFI